MSNNKIVTISRDPFARQEIVRKRVHNATFVKGCYWCGRLRHTPSGDVVMFQYGTQDDASGRINWHTGYFCSIGCHNAYHG